MEKAKLGGRTREKKSQAVLTKEGQREDWRQQMGAQRWDSLSPEQRDEMREEMRRRFGDWPGSRGCGAPDPENKPAA